MAANKIERRDYKTELLGKAEALLSKSPLGGETYASDGTCAASDVEGRFIELGERVRSAIGRAQIRALGDEKMKAGEWTPWIHGDTPAERVEELLRRHHLNERVIAYLEGELAAHVVLGDKLERELRTASDLLRKETRELGSCVETMAQKMEDLGLLAQAAQGIPKWELSAIVEFINKRKTPEGKAALMMLLGGRDARVEDEFRAFDERQAWRSTNPSPSAATGPERVPLPVVPDDYEREWTTLGEPVPSDFWSQFQVFDSNYRWKYSLVNTPADAEVASISAPIPVTRPRGSRSQNQTLVGGPTPQICGRDIQHVRDLATGVSAFDIWHELLEPLLDSNLSLSTHLERPRLGRTTKRKPQGWRRQCSDLGHPVPGRRRRLVCRPVAC